ncbi:esterase family protein [Streptomyces sp. NBC_01387]|uniref:alpha/beta hydrolase n=1 Tax=unclassified Streptomyces TaxID=2593676 RepID=UPI0020251EB3|nr:MULTISPECIES: alpha/beta hydrolase-fold protein [unclassified Streptomyces]MCX4548779.1 esterase family protein [Streptomyces sp. NBC_01500]WSC20365.1 esterase family protein [Streptomyces sp. NBC_01766]WSV54399.1 esterase family protein [Streptomyces sp. NBC_01014]
MSLTGTPFFLAAIALMVVAVLLPLLLWGRVAGPVALRGAARLVMVLFAQATAVLVVFVAVNNSNGLYDNWADLLGTGDHVVAAPELGPDGLGGRQLAAEPQQRAVFKPVSDPRMGPGVRRTVMTGRVSGVRGEVYVWLPPQYNDPAYRHKSFPVVELLAGFPGTATAWFGNLNVQTQLEPMMKRGTVAPFILVSPRTSLLGNQDTGCANVTGVINADTWLSVDVPEMVTDSFRAQRGAHGWAVAGYSAGAHCAVKLALAHPDRYRAAAGLSGYNDPAAEHASITAKNPTLRRDNNPLWILSHAKKPPHTALLITGARHDGYDDGLALRAHAKPPTTVQVVLVTGGHSRAVWRKQVPDVFTWLTAEFRPTGPPGPTGPAGPTGHYTGRAAPTKGI